RTVAAAGAAAAPGGLVAGSLIGYSLDPPDAALLLRRGRQRALVVEAVGVALGAADDRPQDAGAQAGQALLGGGDLRQPALVAQDREDHAVGVPGDQQAVGHRQHRAGVNDDVIELAAQLLEDALQALLGQGLGGVAVTQAGRDQPQPAQPRRPDDV